MRTPRPAAKVVTQSEKPKSGAAVDGFDYGAALPRGDKNMLEDKTSNLALSSGDTEVRSGRVLSMKSLRPLRKQPIAPNYVRELFD